jgi:hypothetical protein
MLSLDVTAGLYGGHHERKLKASPIIHYLFDALTLCAAFKPSKRRQETNEENRDYRIATGCIF